jgi:hypothetical protein
VSIDVIDDDFILTCISFILYRVFPIIVHNQCSDFELVSPVCSGHNVIWIKSPDQKVDINTVAEASFGRDVTEYKCANALIYKLQRKKHSESSDQSNVDNAFSEDTQTSYQLLVMWRFVDKPDVSLRALLIKHSSTMTWDEDKLEKVQSMHIFLCRDDEVVRDTWLLDEVTTLMVMLRWKSGRYITEITISEVTREDDSKEPLQVPSNI